VTQVLLNIVKLLELKAPNIFSWQFCVPTEGS